MLIYNIYIYLFGPAITYLVSNGWSKVYFNLNVRFNNDI